MRFTTLRKASFHIKVVGVALAVAYSALAGPAFARSADEKLWRKACTADAFSLCPLQALSGNRAGVRDCLLKKLDKVSIPCVTVIRAAQQQALIATVPPPAH